MSNKSVMIFSVLDNGAPASVNIHGRQIPLLTAIAGSDPIAAIQKLAVGGPANVELIGLVEVFDAEAAVAQTYTRMAEAHRAFCYGKIAPCYPLHPENLRTLLQVVT